MNILKSYKQGIQEATSRPNMVFLLWLANLFFASVAYFLFSAQFGAAVATSRLATELLRQLDMNVLVEFLTGSSTSFGVLITAVIVIVVLYFMASIFLQGGILYTLIHRRDDETFTQVFFAGAGKYFGRFFRLTIYSLILWIPAIILFMILSGLLKLLTKNPVYEQRAFILTLVRVALALVLVFLIKMIMDYARIKIVTQDARTVFFSLLAAAGFVFRRLRKSLGLYYLLGLTGVAVFLVFWGIRSAFTAASPGAIWLGFFLAQMCIAGRGWLHIAYQAGQTKLFTLEYF